MDLYFFKGKYIKSKWLKLAKKYNIKIDVQGILIILSFIFISVDDL